jgi:hypothetical protein
MATAIGEGFRGPDGHVGYLLRQAHQAFRAAAQAGLGPLGLTLPQYSVLTVADAGPAVDAAERRMTSSLSEADQAVLRRWLTDCALNLTPGPAEPPHGNGNGRQDPRHPLPNHTGDKAP